jgi:hypothetical protein
MSTSPAIGHNQPCGAADTDAPEHQDVQAHTVAAPAVPAPRRRVYTGLVLVVIALAQAAWIGALALGLIRIFEG